MINPTELRKDCEKIIPALKAWFDSQGISEERRITVCGIMLGEGIGNRAGDVISLGVGLAFVEKAIEIGAKAAFIKKVETDG